MFYNVNSWFFSDGDAWYIARRNMFRKNIRYLVLRDKKLNIKEEKEAPGV